MNNPSDKVTAIFQEIAQTDLWDEEMPISLQEYESLLVAEDTELLFQMIDQQDEEAIKNVTLEDLMQMPFDKSKKCIEKFSLAKRIQVLSELDTRRSYLYSQASRYGAGNQRDSEPLSAKDWRLIMGRIKHLEILQAWLYGIN